MVISMWASMATWFTPTILFCFLNLMIGSIFIASKFKTQNKQNQLSEHNSPQLVRAPSLLARVKSINFSLYKFDHHYPFHSETQFADPLQDQHQTECEIENHDPELDHHMSRGKSDTCHEATEETTTKAIRLKTLAEQKYGSSDLKSALKYAKRSLRLCPDLDGTAELVTAFKTLRVAKSTATGTLEWYKILQVEPFSHINIIKKQYKKLALTLHPDKNPFAASEEAFKLVGEAFRVLSDKIRRKEYDMKLRIAMQAAAEVTLAVSVETFWTACSTCRLLHQFERRYLGHNLMCPSCKKSFKAVEASDNNLVDNGRIGERMKTRSSSAGVRIKFRNSERKLKMSSVGEILKRAESTSFERSDNVNKIGNENLSCGGSGAVIEGLRSKRVRKLRTLDKNEEASSRVVVSERLKAKKRAKTGEEMMTLAEMQMLAKRKSSEKKLKDKEKDKGKERRDTCGSSKGESSETEKRSSKKGISNRTSKSGSLKIMVVEDSEEKDKGMEKRDTCGSSKGESSETEKRSSKKGNSNRTSKSGGLEIMVVEDSDFYDFDRDRVERSFRKGQVWAIYDDDGMPRHYGLIDDVVSVSPFEVKMSWLDLQNDLDEALICWEKLGFHICCGRFKVSRKTSVNSLNIFSHVVDCDRAARELYRIYPKKGSVWALYNENALDTEGRNVIVKDKRCYDIVIFLTSYSEIHGLSMAYLEKVNGFKTVFKRREIGCHAIKWLEKNDVRLFSHQIPARKLSAEETSGIAKDCWELDPASLPPELLTIGW